jgi:hypothetical protein
MKISIISFDMAHNCLGRAYLLAKVLQRKYKIEINGFLFPIYGDKIWKPCDTGEFNYSVGFFHPFVVCVMAAGTVSARLMKYKDKP